ncbi:hypothetical protein EJ06DRAFT_518572 [Trichodelitschia bisporula]|uniref:DUF6604 domain-containing protein n=1 Tax=Trichodelitschia bisporula TaxID=703511 RepID=A0A6G1I7M5_9PEZI|nr:hypothetical protein EJ06DRAFT_518572 [Trichodelitschia bisporula]
MLPSILASRYRSYKPDTDESATWLATTAKRLQFPTSAGKAPALAKTTRLKGKARKLEYIIAFRNFADLAKWIVEKTKENVPAMVVKTMDRAIAIRTTFVQHFDDDEGHTHLLGVSPSERQTKLTPEDEVLYKNKFQGLPVEEPSAEFLAAEPAPPSAPSPYTTESDNDPFELFVAGVQFLLDVNTIRKVVVHCWKTYQVGFMSLSAVAITSNTAIEIVRQLEEQFIRDNPLGEGTLAPRRLVASTRIHVRGVDPANFEKGKEPFNLECYEIQTESFLPLKHLDPPHWNNGVEVFDQSRKDIQLLVRDAGGHGRVLEIIQQAIGVSSHPKTAAAVVQAILARKDVIPTIKIPGTDYYREEVPGLFHIYVEAPYLWVWLLARSLRNRVSAKSCWDPGLKEPAEPILKYLSHWDFSGYDDP